MAAGKDDYKPEPQHSMGDGRGLFMLLPVAVLSPNETSSRNTSSGAQYAVHALVIHFRVPGRTVQFYTLLYAKAGVSRPSFWQKDADLSYVFRRFKETGHVRKDGVRNTMPDAFFVRCTELCKTIGKSSRMCRWHPAVRRAHPWPAYYCADLPVPPIHFVPQADFGECLQQSSTVKERPVRSGFIESSNSKSTAR